MGKPVVIIHFQPLQLYPPVMNLLTFLAGKQQGKVIVFTTNYIHTSPKPFEINSSHISIRKIGISGNGLPSLIRYYNYIKFYAGCFFQLLYLRPDRILYVDPISVYPAYLYKRFVKSNAALMVHYHEYTSPQEYLQPGMTLIRYFHRKEQWLYSRLNWISHTNEDRLTRFLQDEGLQRSTTSHIMPNYPGDSWLINAGKQSSPPVKIIYVGAVSRDTMHFDPFVTWILKMNGQYTFDIYSFNVSERDKKWLQQCHPQYIKFYDGVDYQALPSIISRYDVGVILYNGHIPNYVINAPNKLFEYLACGLDVWVAREITGCAPYYTSGCWPKVLPVDFQQLKNFDAQSALNRDGLAYCRPVFTYEQVYPEIAEALMG